MARTQIGAGLYRGAAIILVLCGTARAQLVASSEYFLRESTGAFTNVTWSVRVSTECRATTLVRCYEATLTGAPSWSRVRVLEQARGHTNWTTVCRARSDLFGFVEFSRARRWRLRSDAAQRLAPCAERLALVSRDGVVAIAPLDAPQRQSISGALLNTGADPWAAGSLSLSLTGDMLQFRLFLTGASPRYTLWINGVSCGTYEAQNGRVEVGSYPETGPPIGDVKRFTITDDAGVEVLTGYLY